MSYFGTLALWEGLCRCLDLAFPKMQANYAPCLILGCLLGDRFTLERNLALLRL